MAKLYPPNISGTLPAFCPSGSGTTIVVPFSMNRAVSINSIQLFAIKIKTVQNNDFVASQLSSSFNISANEATFYFADNSIFTVGQSYKVQLAYVGQDDVVGYYSTVGVIKYTAQPTVTISGLTSSGSNNHLYSYTGVYTHEDDSTEKEYSYEFRLYDSDKNLLLSSGVLLHNTSKDTDSDSSEDTYTFEQDLEKNKSYYIQYSVTTINELEAASPYYRIMQTQSVAPVLPANLTVTLNFDNAYIQVALIATANATATTGKFKLMRSCANQDGNFLTWNELGQFSLNQRIPNIDNLFKDFTIEQGKTYQYGIVEYNDNNIVSDKKCSAPITVDFEDAFLYDGTRQLKIRFNPKISSFKTDVLESKTDTIGSKYPFIFRNGNVSYKEFAITGLISYQQDEEQLFMTDEELTLDNSAVNYERAKTVSSQTFPTNSRNGNLTSENFYAERTFKLAVLDWLNNGEYKLFKSPAEGNYLVRLMNVSLSPEDQLSRMLHSFSAQAYEIDDTSYSSLVTHGLLDPTVSFVTDNFITSYDVNFLLSNITIPVANITWNGDRTDLSTILDIFAPVSSDILTQSQLTYATVTESAANTDFIDTGIVVKTFDEFLSLYFADSSIPMSAITAVTTDASEYHFLLHDWSDRTSTQTINLTYDGSTEGASINVIPTESDVASYTIYKISDIVYTTQDLIGCSGIALDESEEVAITFTHNNVISETNGYYYIDNRLNKWLICSNGSLVIGETTIPAGTWLRNDNSSSYIKTITSEHILHMDDCIAMIIDGPQEITVSTYGETPMSQSIAAGTYFRYWSDTYYTKAITNASSGNVGAYQINNDILPQNLTANILLDYTPTKLVFHNFKPNVKFLLGENSSLKWTLSSQGTENNEDLILLPETFSWLGDNALGTIKLTNASIIDQGTITVYYDATEAVAFDAIDSITGIDVICRQWYGTNENILNDINNVKDALFSFNYINIYKRDIFTYISQTAAEAAALTNPSALHLYPIINLGEIIYGFHLDDYIYVDTNSYNRIITNANSLDDIDISTIKPIPYTVSLDDATYDVETNDKLITNPTSYTTITSSIGTLIECGYTINCSHYIIEPTVANWSTAKWGETKVSKNFAYAWAVANEQYLIDSFRDNNLLDKDFTDTTVTTNLNNYQSALQYNNTWYISYLAQLNNQLGSGT